MHYLFIFTSSHQFGGWSDVKINFDFFDSNCPKCFESNRRAQNSRSDFRTEDGAQLKGD